MWIERALAPELLALSKQHSIVVLTGPRQVGKTSLLERLFPDLRYASLDVASHAEMAETRPRDFLALYPPPVIIDEVQYAPAFFRDIKTAVDARRGERGLFLLTGSQNFQLMAQVADSLAGRAAVVPLLGLSSNEWADFHGNPGIADWLEFLWRGGFPALWADRENAPGRDRWYQGYLATYLERDVRSLANIGRLRDFERLLRACAARTAQTLNMADLARDVGIAPSTARQWLSVLQTSNQILLLEPYHRSLGKRLAKSPKLYFTDSGLAAFLMGFQSAASLRQSQQLGALWENHVVVQWLRWRDWLAPAAALWYWRDQGGDEVDLVIELDAKLYGIECKVSERPSANALKGLSKMQSLYGAATMPRGFIACTAEQPFDLAPWVTAVNGWRTWPLSA